MVRPAVPTATPTPEPQKPPQAGDIEDLILDANEEGTNQTPQTPSGSAPDGEPDFPVSGPKVNLQAAASLAFQKALSQAVARNQIRLSEATRIVEDENIWANLWLGYQMMTGYAEVNPTKLAEGITYYTDAYVVPALQAMPSQGIDPKNWSKSLGKAIDSIWQARENPDMPEQYYVPAARQAALGYAVSEQAEAKDKKAYLELLATLNRQGYVDVYNALKTNFPSIYARWKALEAGFPGLTHNDFSTYLNRYIAPAVGEVDPTQSGTEFLKGMRRNLENLERLDTGRELIPEEGYRVDEETGEVVPVSPTPKGGWPEPGPTIGEQTEAEEAELRRRGYVPFTDEKGTRWLPAPDAQDYITGAGGGTAAAIARERVEAEAFNRRQEAIEADIRGTRARNEAAARKYAQEERIAAQVAPYTGTVSSETSAREAFNVGRRNLGLLEALASGGRAAYEDALLGSNIEEKFGQARLRSEFPTPSAGYETRVGGRFGTTNPLEISQRLQAERDPLLRQRMAEPLAQQFPDLWEEFSQKRAYGWEKGPGHVAAPQFSAQEPFDMPFESFVRQRLAPDTRNPVWAQPPKEGEVRTPIANWGFKQPWEGGPAPRGFSQPRPTSGPARMTPIRIGRTR